MRQLFLTLALMVGSAALAQTTPATPATPAPAAPAPTTPATPAPAPAAPADTTQPAPATPAPTTPGAPATDAQPADPETPVATIGSETVTLGQFESFFRQLAGRTVNAQGVPLTDDVLGTFGQYRPQLLEQFARQLAVLQLAKKAGVSADAAKIDKDFTEAKSGFPSDAEFQSALSASGFTDPDTFRTSLEDGAVYSAYLDTLKGRFKFGDAVVAGYYQLNKAKFTQTAQACVKHILVGSQAEAQDIVKKLGSGSAFADLAKVSKDPGSAAQGGDLGCLKAGETVPPFDKAAFTGPLSTPQVVQTEFGWHVLVVGSRTAAGLQPLADVQAKIRDQLSGEAAQKYLDAQIAKFKITTSPEVVTVAPAAPGTGQPGSDSAAPAPAPGPAAPATDPAAPAPAPAGK